MEKLPPAFKHGLVQNLAEFYEKEISLCGICQTGFEKFTHRRGRNTGWDDQSSKTF